MKDKFSVFTGVPNYNNIFNTSNLEYPLYCYLLNKIKYFPIETQLTGKKLNKTNQLITQDFRYYRFECLTNEIKKHICIMFLYITNEKYFFKKQPFFEISNTGVQRIPLVFKTMSKMTEKEIKTIYKDLD